MAAGASRLRADELWVDCAAARAIDDGLRRQDPGLQTRMIRAGLVGGPYARIIGRDGRRYRAMQRATVERFAEVWGVNFAALLAGGTGLELPPGDSQPALGDETRAGAIDAEFTVLDDRDQPEPQTNRERLLETGSEPALPAAAAGWSGDISPIRRATAPRGFSLGTRGRLLAILIVLLSVAGLAILGNWALYDYPARTVAAFYSALNHHDGGTGSHLDTKTAWQLLAPDFQESKKWFGDYTKFDGGFETTDHQSDIRSKPKLDSSRGDIVQFLSILFSGTVTYDVTLVATDRFQKSDCPVSQDQIPESQGKIAAPSDKIRENCDNIFKDIWGKDYTFILKKLRQGTVDDPLHKGNEMVTLNRWYWKEFTLERSFVWTWLVSDIRTIEVGVNEAKEGVR